MALSKEWQARLDAAAMPGKPDVVMLTRPLAERLMENHQRTVDTLEYLHNQISGMVSGRATRVLATEVFNRLSGAYYDPKAYKQSEDSSGGE